LTLSSYLSKKIHAAFVFLIFCLSGAFKTRVLQLEIVVFRCGVSRKEIALAGQLCDGQISFIAQAIIKLLKAFCQRGDKFLLRGRDNV